VGVDVDAVDGVGEGLFDQVARAVIAEGGGEPVGERLERAPLI
jgi:hypothetical protein